MDGSQSLTKTANLRRSAFRVGLRSRFVLSVIGIVPFFGDELSIQPEDDVWCERTADFIESLEAKEFPIEG